MPDCMRSISQKYGSTGIHRSCRGIGLVLAAVFCAVGWSVPSAADTITVTGGNYLHSVPEGEQIHLSAAGLTIDGFPDPGATLKTPGICQTCQAGDPLWMGGFSGDGITTADVTFQGQSYHDAMIVGDIGLLALDVARFPSSSESLLQLTAPFTFFATLQANLDSTWVDLPTLRGGGTALATFALDTRTGSYDLRGIDYRFAKDPGSSPTPEPASLVLLGTGLAGALLARRRPKGGHSHF